MTELELQSPGGSRLTADTSATTCEYDRWQNTSFVNVDPAPGPNCIHISAFLSYTTILNLTESAEQYAWAHLTPAHLTHQKHAH